MKNLKKSDSFLTSVKSAVVWNTLSRIAGLLKHIVIAGAIGLSAQLDVFYMAIAILGVVVFSWGGLFGLVSVPSLTRRSQKAHPEEFKRYASELFSFSILVSVFLSLFLLFFVDQLSAFAAGFDQERKRQLVSTLVVMIPVALIYLPGRQILATLRATRNFSPVYKSEFLVTVVILSVVIVFKDRAMILAWSFVFGTIIGFVYLLLRTDGSLCISKNPMSKNVRALFSSGVVLLLLQVVHYAMILVDRQFVSYLPVGSVAALAYAITIVTLIPGLTSFTVPFLTIMSEENSIQNEKLNQFFSLVVYIGIGATVALTLLHSNIVEILLQRGMFNSSDTHLVGRGILVYASMVIPLFLLGPLDQVFLSRNYTGVVLRRALVGLISNIVLNYFFMFRLEMGLVGVALATTLSYWIMLILNLLALDKLGLNANFRSLGKWAAWICCNQLVIAILLVVFASKLSSISYLLIAGGTLAVNLLVAGLIYRGEESMLVRNALSGIVGN